MTRIFDLAVIGGGINGTGIARDAAGRGHSVFLCEEGDLARATSSASTKLIHGGLRYLEYYEFRLVRESLLEREVLWGIAPHIIWPLRFVLPHHQGLRPAWLLRTGLFLYDHIGGRKRLPPTRSLDLAHDPAGAPLKPEFSRGFEYSDCSVEDARLVVLNAADAAARGAEIATHTECVHAAREEGAWSIAVRDADGQSRVVRARALVNAAGPWVASVLGGVVRANVPAAIRLVQGSHIVVRRLYEHDRCYIFQNGDGRIFFAIPYERDFTLIGTTDLDYGGDPGAARISEAEIAYLCAGASEYFRTPVTPEQVVWSYTGVRPLHDDGSRNAQAATRDYVLALDAPEGQPALLSIFGGMPGPMTIIDTIADRHYGDRVKMAFAVAELLNEEAKALQADGVDLIQFDEPAFNVYMAEVNEWGIKALERAAEGLTCATAVHICYGYGIKANTDWKQTLGTEWRQYEEIFPAINKSSIRQVAVECRNSRVPLELLSALPNKVVQAGVIDVASDEVETAEDVVKVIEDVAKFVPKSNIIPTTNCGMAPMPRHIAEAKLMALGKGANLARERLG